MKEQKNYTTIQVEKQSTTKLAGKTGKSLLAHLKSKDGLIHEIMEEEPLNKIVSVSLYPDPNASVREGLNNAFNQCRTAQKLGASPEINVIFDDETRNVTIEEIDSMGMPVQIFEDVYMHLARSGNMEGTESGMFGIGKKSFNAISDSLLFETYSRETGEKYQFECKGSVFDDDLPTPQMDTYGTRITFTVRKEINMAELATYVTNIVKFAKVKTNLVILENLYKSDAHKEFNKDPVFSKGTTQIGLVDPKEFLEKKIRDAVNLSDDQKIQWVEINTKNYYLAYAFVDKYNGVESQYHQEFNYLIGIPVSLGEKPNESKDKNELPYIGAGHCGHFLYIKNEREISPVASRESLTNESFEKLETSIKSELEKFFEKINVKTAKQYREHPFKYFVKKLPHSDFTKFMPEDTINFNELLGLQLFAYQANSEKDQSSWTLQEELLQNEKLEFVSSYNKVAKKINTLLEKRPNVVVLVPDGTKDYYSHGQNKHDRHAALSIMLKAEIPNISDYIKNNNLDMPKNSNLGEVAVRYLTYGGDVTQMDLVDLDKNCIRIPKENLEMEDTNSIKDLANRLSYSELRHYAVFKDQKKFEDTKSITLEEFVRSIQNKEFETSKGKLTALQIVKDYENVEFLRVHQSKFSKKLTFDFCFEQTKTDLIIIDDESNKNIQALMLFMGINKIHYGTIGNNYDDFIGKQFVEQLEIEFEGHWTASPENAYDRLIQIKKPLVREFYAQVYSEIFQYSEGWESDDEKDIQICKEIHQLFLDYDGVKDLSQIQIALELYQKFKTPEKTYHKTIKKLVREIICEDLKKSPDREAANKKALELFYDQKIENLAVIISKENDEELIKVSFTPTQKISLNGDMKDILHDINEAYLYRKEIIIDGNKIEVVFH